MLCRKGMTLMEIMVVLIIIGIAAAFFFPNFNTSTQQAYAQAAENNLLAIYSAQVNYFNNNNGVYCINSGANPTCGDSLAHLNTNLNLNISDSVYTDYHCATDPSGFLCTATNGNTTLNINNTAVVLSGGVNPSCAGTYCPYLS